MDRRGWVNVDDLLKKLDITIEELDHIVENNDKKRFGYDHDKKKIRAHQGHSAKLNLVVEHKEVTVAVPDDHVDLVVAVQVDECRGAIVPDIDT